jgi:hypothetical protein
MNFKALGYGLAAFFAAYVFMAFVGSVLVDFGVDAAGIMINVLGYLVPVVAGYVGAIKAPRWRIAHGIVGGSIGVVPVTLAPMLLDPAYKPSGIPVILLWCAVLAALGAVFGDHVAKKRAG